MLVYIDIDCTYTPSVCYHLIIIYCPLFPSHFPSGVKFHHDKNYMSRILDDKAHPYIFHMCWTANKKQKLENFAQVKMWYLKGQCAQTALTPTRGTVYKDIVRNAVGNQLPTSPASVSKTVTTQRFDYLSDKCCAFAGNL